MRSLDEGVVVLDGDGRVRDVNPRWCELTGLRADDMIGTTPPYAWWPADGVEARTEDLAHALAAAKPARAERDVLRSDDTLLRMVVSTVPIRGDEGEAEAFVTTYTDVSELRHAEMRFRALLESGPDPVIGIDLDGRVTVANSRAAAVFGHSIADLLGQPASALLPDLAVNVLTATRSASARSGLPMETRAFRKSPPTPHSRGSGRSNPERWMGQDRREATDRCRDSGSRSG